MTVTSISPSLFSTVTKKILQPLKNLINRIAAIWHRLTHDWTNERQSLLSQVDELENKVEELNQQLVQARGMEIRAIHANRDYERDNRRLKKENENLTSDLLDYHKSIDQDKELIRLKTVVRALEFKLSSQNEYIKLLKAQVSETNQPTFSLTSSISESSGESDKATTELMNLIIGLESESEIKLP